MYIFCFNIIPEWPIQLHFSDEVSHLGHILTFNLRDKNDTIRATKDLNRKSNYILSTFKSVDPFVKCFFGKVISSIFIWLQSLDPLLP